MQAEVAQTIIPMPFDGKYPSMGCLLEKEKTKNMIGERGVRKELKRLNPCFGPPPKN